MLGERLGLGGAPLFISTSSKGSTNMKYKSKSPGTAESMRCGQDSTLKAASGVGRCRGLEIGMIQYFSFSDFLLGRPEPAPRPEHFL